MEWGILTFERHLNDKPRESNPMNCDGAVKCYVAKHETHQNNNEYTGPKEGRLAY